jgi:hypothetical protein
LSENLGTELLGTAREAFVQSLELAAAISAGIAHMKAIMVGVLLRRVRASSHAGAEPEPALSR